MLNSKKGKLRILYFLDSDGGLDMKYGNRILLTNIKENDIIEDLRIYSED